MLYNQSDNMVAVEPSLHEQIHQCKLGSHVEIVHILLNKKHDEYG